MKRLLAAAMVGTERQPLAWPPAADPVGALLAEATGTAPEPAIGLLRCAAAIAVCAQAGAGGAPAQPLPEAAAAEARAALQDPAALAGLDVALRDGPQRLQQELLQRLGDAGLRLPPPLLPAALDLGRRQAALRPALTPVLGERGRWLAAHNEHWRYALGAAETGSVDTRWSEGSLEQRRAVLAEERRRDPASARERLQAALPELPARERAELLTALAEGLSPEDEALLDSLRADRGREVRAAALALLQRLPGSAHAGRARARLSAVLTRDMSGHWHIEPPAAADPTWAADGIDAARPKHESLGERAWWLHQLVRQVPPAWWTQRTGLDAPALLAWARGGDWAEALLRGWLDALRNTPDAAWCDALLDAWPAGLLRESPATVLSWLPRDRREHHWQRQLRGDWHGGAVGLTELLAQLLPACSPGETLSPALSQALAAAVIETLRGQRLHTDYTLRAYLPELACVLHPDALAALQPLPRSADETPALADAMATLDRVVATRCRFLDVLAPNSAERPDR